MYRNIFGRNIYERSKCSCVRSCHDLCAGAHAHSLEGTLYIHVTSPSFASSVWNMRLDGSIAWLPDS